jgi:tRNA pseudouridine55 synthase
MDGLLIVDKPAGMSSHDVVNRVRKIFAEKSVGHLGTLDPLATGVLPLLLGRYTRLAQYFGSSDKEYTGTVRFGFATDTYDSEGTATGEAQSVALDDAWLQSAIAELRGTIQQMPPAYSAKKINGVPAHRLARKGQTPELRAVEIQVERFEAAIITPEEISIHVTVSAGGYIRCLAHELGQRLGCGAHLTSLRRVRAGDFALDVSATLAALEQSQSPQELLVPASHVLCGMPSLLIDEATATRLKNGMQTNLPDFGGAPLLRILHPRDRIFAIGKRMAGTLFAPQTVLG